MSEHTELDLTSIERPPSQVETRFQRQRTGLHIKVHGGRLTLWTDAPPAAPTGVAAGVAVLTIAAALAAGVFGLIGWGVGAPAWLTVAAALMSFVLVFAIGVVLIVCFRERPVGAGVSSPIANLPPAVHTPSLSKAEVPIVLATTVLPGNGEKPSVRLASPILTHEGPVSGEPSAPTTGTKATERTA